MITTNGDDVAESAAVGWVFRKKGASYIYVGTFGVGHSTFSKEEGKPYINKLSAHMGSWVTYKYSIENNTLKMEKIDEGETKSDVDYPKLPGTVLKIRE